ncbi:MAG: MarR family winged helix-turn-helix transcriptional regulator [Alphaproteobacteria bacterium]
MSEAYADLIGLIERLHRRCLDVIKAEIDRLEIRDLNAAQAMILFNIGERELPMGELIERGYYLGSNVSYNIKKMVENEYVVQTRSPYDRRSFHVRSSEKGQEICSRLEALFGWHAKQLEDGLLSGDDMALSREALTKLEGFWSSARHTAPPE